MKYRILKPSNLLINKIRQWCREYRDRFHLITDFRTELNEVRFVSNSNRLTVDFDSKPGCTCTIRKGELILSYATDCDEIAKSLINYLQKFTMIGEGQSLGENVPFKTKIIRYAHEKGRLMSNETKIRARERREEVKATRPQPKFKTVISAVLLALKAEGSWLILTERAKLTAERTQYLDTDYVYHVLIHLAHAARKNSESQGLGMSWASFLGQLGSHNFIPNTSSAVIDQYYKEYHVTHNGKSYCIGAHIRRGNGSAKDCLRIYLALPDKPGDPIILGQIGAHLPTSKRSH